MEIDRPIIIALILFTAFLLGFFWVMPAYRNLSNLEIVLAQKQAQLDTQHNYYSAITDTYYKIQSKKDGMQIIDDSLPAKADFGQLIYYFQKQTNDSGLVLKNLYLSQSAVGKSVKDITFSMNVFGDYSSLGNFLSALEKSARLFEVTNISFGSSVMPAGSSASQFQSQAAFNFNLQIKTHSY